MEIKQINIFFGALFLLPVSYPLMASITVPAGFEELVTGQKIFLDVYFLGQSVGMYEANVNFETIQFLNPVEVLKALNLPLQPSDARYQELLKKLSSPLPRLGNLSCSSNNGASGCGYINSKDIDLIYDENESKVNIFVDQKIIPNSNEKEIYFSPSTQTENAFIHQQLLNVVGDEDYKSLSLQGSGALGLLTDGYIGFDWSLTSYTSDNSDSKNINVDDIYYRYSLGNRHYVQAGRMDARDLSGNLGGNINFTMLPLGAISGARVGTSLSYLNQAEAGKGSPITVLLSAKSRVDAYRGNQLLGTFYLPNGSNTLDTGNFPTGSYLVTLKIYEDNNLVRTEDQPFTRSGGVGDGTLQWFLQFGQTADRQIFSSGDDHSADTPTHPVVQVGFKAPLPKNFVATAGIANVASSDYAEGGMEWDHTFASGFIDGNLSLQGNYFYGDDGSRGNVQQVSYNDGFSLSFYRNDAQASSCSGGDNDIDDYVDIGCYTSMTTNFSVPVTGWTVSLAWTYNKTTRVSDYYDPSTPFEDNMIRNTEDDSSSNTYQVSLNRSDSFKGVMLSSRVGGYKRISNDGNNDDNGIYVGFTLSRNNSAIRTQPHSNSTLSADYRTSKNSDDQLIYTAGKNWDWGENNDREVGIDIGGTNTDYVNGSVHGKINGQYGDAGVTLSDSYDNQENKHNTSVSGTWNSSLAIARSGMYWGPGGNGIPSAAVAVKIADGADGEEQDAKVNVSVDGGGFAEMPSGSQALFPVSGFTMSQMSVEESELAKNGSAAVITNGAGKQSLFMLPGKLKVRDVKMESHYTFAGRMFTHDGKSLPYGVVLNASMYASTADGSFTAEMNKKADILYLLSERQMYQCKVNVKAKRDVIRFVGDTACEITTLAALPEELQNIAQLHGLRDKNATNNIAANMAGEE
ncbi:TcfC E-set like domain-containing protein [Rahnella sikkimica]|uniref:Fimbrial protein n=1 Tax=Rahnella sikkimica TaxID=1805933 RepID=A0A2L1UTM2_9GAMM|nr:TcfC E-set like domain-containing protein [Rahnella sikkimica]AVF36312.1 fimbrial protein [Rahnella sikkimica]